MSFSYGVNSRGPMVHRNELWRSHFDVFLLCYRSPWHPNEQKNFNDCHNPSDQSGELKRFPPVPDVGRGRNQLLRSRDKNDVCSTLPTEYGQSRSLFRNLPFIRTSVQPFLHQRLHIAQTQKGIDLIAQPPFYLVTNSAFSLLFLCNNLNGISDR